MKVRLSGLAVGGLLVFLYVSFVGLLPFAPRGTEMLDAAHENSSFSQSLFVLSAFITFAVALFMARGGRVRRPDTWQVAAFAWAAVSIAWSPVPVTSFMRLGLTLLTFMVAWSAVQALGPWRAFRTLAKFLAVLVVASLVSGVALPAAVHQSGDPEPAVIGAWRGVFFHKNTAGFAAAIGVMTSIACYARERSRWWLIAAVAALLFLVLTKSKTSMAMLVPAVSTGWALARTGPRTRSRVVLVAVPILLSIIVLGGLFYGESVIRVVEDPDALTGRAAIWATLWHVIADHPLTGIGFGALYGDPEASVFSQYGNGWVAQARHGHNGYLDLVATIGWIGAFIVIAAFVVRPLIGLLRSQLLAKDMCLYVSLLVFVVLHNGLESSLMDRGRPGWLVLALVVASLRYQPLVRTAIGKKNVDRSSSI
jgi:exopolysaccharide production protein ExoQ